MKPCPCPSGCDDCSERVLCACLNITEANVKAALVSLEIRSVQDLRQHTGAGDGCTASHRVLRTYIEHYAQSSSAEPICSVK
jgi:bacterioferritin-associated ferredoxin